MPTQSSTLRTVLHVPPITAVSSVKLLCAWKNAALAGKRSETGRHWRNVRLASRLLANHAWHDDVVKLYENVVSNGCGKGVGTGYGGSGIEGAISAAS